MMQHLAICLIGKKAWIARTEEGKPYLLNDTSDLYPHFSANISHAKSTVVLASDTDLLVGVDVVDLSSVLQLDTYAASFPEAEWNIIMTDSDPVVAFACRWALREAYVKAMG